MTWRRHILGLACYRAGRLNQAAAQLAEADDPSWGPHSASWPVLAMVHQRLGHAAEARRWLEQANEQWLKLSPLARAIDSPTALTPANWPWQDWTIFEFLLAEANTSILGHRGEADCLDHLHQAYVRTKLLGENKKAEEQFQAAVSGRDKVASAWLARGRVYRLLGEKERAKADFAKAHELNPKDPEIQKEYESSGRKDKTGQ
jgi:tetratricopeptide (TPR) repeat protein